MSIDVMAVADSDSYLKWACSTLDRLIGADSDVRASAVVVRSPLTPTPKQTDAAVAGTAVERPTIVGLRELRRIAQERQPDVVLVAATGPVAEMVARHVVGSGPSERPALISGLPGMALPATDLGVGWRRWSDAFIVHSRREAEAYGERFAAHRSEARITLTHLPFLGQAYDDALPCERVVFASQSIVPPSVEERETLLDGLARTAESGYDVVVKLRARAGERQTHNEAHPLDELWLSVHERLGHPVDRLRFADGPMSRWLVPGSALVTVSSTAAVESLALGLPTVLLDDFGVSEGLLNSYFEGSSCLASLPELADLLRRGGPTPDPTWLEQNYLHSAPSELPGTVRELVARRNAGQLPDVDGVRPLSWHRHVRTVARSMLPDAVGRRLARTSR